MAKMLENEEQMCFLCKSAAAVGRLGSRPLCHDCYARMAAALSEV